MTITKNTIIVMCAALCDPAILQINDLICVADR